MTMRISILIPTYNRPEQLAEAVASVVAQDLDCICEVLIGDNSNDSMREANAALIAASPLAGLIRHVKHDPPQGNFENQWALAKLAKCEKILFLHDDDKLNPGGLASLASACEEETDERVKVWFGRNHVMDEHGAVDMTITKQCDSLYGKDGPGATQPVWKWCLTQSLPPNSALLDRATYLLNMQGARDGNVGDWGLWVRTANSGAWGRFVPEYVWSYRVQYASQSQSGRGMDIHRWYEIGQQLEVPPEAELQKAYLLATVACVATMRYLRDGERVRAFRCLTSRYWTWRQRVSPRGLATTLFLLTPRPFWLWALRTRA
ncbi:MAG: glycosyltransferase family 2 protein [Rhizobiaceae bacterium]|nr:MAG: glycosyltransferase family 2 protein [Rhizobiaceae bacterium]